MAQTKKARQAAKESGATAAKAHAKKALADTRKEMRKAIDAENRERLKILKKQGLYSGDLRKKPTRYAKSLIHKFSDVIAGRATAVKLPDAKAAKPYAEGYKTKGDRVVIPTAPGQTFRFNPKTAEIEGKRVLPTGKVAKSRILPREKGKLPGMGPIPPGKTRYYSIYFRRGTKLVLGYRTDSFAELQKFMEEYTDYNDWQDYVVTEDF